MKNIVSVLSILAAIAIAFLVTVSLHSSTQSTQPQIADAGSRQILLPNGLSLTNAHRISVPSGEVFTHYFGSVEVKKALANSGSVNVQVYYGKHQDGTSGYVVSGVDTKGKEMILMATTPGGTKCARQTVVSCDRLELQNGNSFANFKLVIAGGKIDSDAMLPPAISTRSQTRVRFGKVKRGIASMAEYSLIMDIVLLSPMLPISVGLWRGINLEPEMRILFLYLVIGFVADVSSTWFIRNGRFVLGMWHVFIVVEYIFALSVISSWQDMHRKRVIFQFVLILYVLFWIVAKFTFEPLGGLYSFTASISRVILTLAAGYTLFVVIANHTQPLFRYQRFWVLLAFVLLFAGTLMPVALVGALFSEGSAVPIPLLSINWALNIVTNIIFMIGFLCPQTPRS